MKIEDLRRFEDIHTHVKAGEKSICSFSPKDAIALFLTDENQPYSIELHPWYASAGLLDEFLKACELCKDDSRFVAIGEIGLDAACETEIELQKECFRAALIKAEEQKMPVILHIVKAWDELFCIIEEVKPTIPIIIHGYRKNVELAQQLVKKGFYISIGRKFNPDVPKQIPADRLFHETDTVVSTLEN